MGGTSSRRSTEDNYGSGVIYRPRGLPPLVVGEGVDDDDDDDDNVGIHRDFRASSDKSRSTKSNLASVRKVSLLGQAVGLGKGAEVLDTLGSSLSSLHISGGFVSGVATKGNKIAILSFEVANTIVKGSTLMQSLSKDNIKHLKEVVLPSEGVQLLISDDMDELLRIAASDKRLGSELTFHFQKQLKEEAETTMEHLKNLVQYTAELYHELHELARLEQVFFTRKQIEEENPNAPSRGDSLAKLRADLKSQKKHVRSLQKKSLWSKSLEEVLELLVDIVHFIHMEIHNAFGTADTQTPIKTTLQKLGAAGLSLHYANIITQIDTLVTRSGFAPPGIRDSLYQGLPPYIKSAMRSKIHSFNPKEELTIPGLKAEMEKTLQWLVPIATNTTKGHHCFGWVGEWANTGFEATRKPSCPLGSFKIETLQHADKEKTEECILKLVVLLHHLICQSNATNGGTKLPVKSLIRSPNEIRIQLSMNRPDSLSPTLTTEDQEMLRDVIKRKPTLVISKSHKFDRDRLSKQYGLTKSRSYSSNREPFSNKRPNKRRTSIPIINFDIDRIKALDVIDAVIACE